MERKQMYIITVVNRRRSSISGRSSTVLEQFARQFVVGFPVATETHAVPAVIPADIIM